MRKLAESSWKTMNLSSEMLKSTLRSTLDPLKLRSNISNSIWVSIIRHNRNSNSNNWGRVKKNRNRLKIRRVSLGHLREAHVHSSILVAPWETYNQKRYWVKSQTPSYLVEGILLMAKWEIRSWWWQDRNSNKLGCQRWCLEDPWIQAVVCQPSKRNQLLQLLQTQRRSGWEESESKLWISDKYILIALDL